MMAIDQSFNPRGGGGGYNQMYSFFLPQGQDLCMGSRWKPSKSCYCPDLIIQTCGQPAMLSFCGYHSSFDAVDVTGKTIHVIYQALPYANVTAGLFTCKVNNGPNGAVADSQNSTIAHELAETITDPDGNAWSRGTGPLADEIVDICHLTQQNPIYLHAHAYSIQKFYSNAVQDCVGAYKTLALTHDLNFDMNSDIVWRNGSDTAIWLMDGAAMLSSSPLGGQGKSWVLKGQSDFDGDGRADLVWDDVADRYTLIWFMNGTQVSSSQTYGEGVWSVASIGDFNGDGGADLLWATDNLNTSNNFDMWLMRGPSILSSAYFGTMPPGWFPHATGDFNGDGKSDLLWENYDAGNRAIWFMNGTQVLSSAGLPTSRPTLGGQ
jgi:FG-GAP-like repeat